jgi:hypothetical protein
MEWITGYAQLKGRSLLLNGQVAVKSSAATLSDAMADLYNSMKLAYPKFHKMDRLSQAGFLTTELLLSDGALRDYDRAAVALVFANANSSLDADQRYHQASKAVPSPALFVYTLPNIVQGEISIRHKLTGENAFFVVETFDAALLNEYAHSLLKGNTAEACVAGWMDVLEEQHDVLVYLVEKRKRGVAMEHSAAQIKKLYQ